MDPLLLVILVGVVVAGLIVTITTVTASRRSKRKRTAIAAQERATAELAELEVQAGQALVRADESIRVSEDELAFATAEFGAATAADFATALERAKAQLQEAFRTNQLLHDAHPETAAERREMNGRIVQLCTSIEQMLRGQTERINARRSAVQQAPDAIAKVRADVSATRTAIDPARQKLTGLAERYTDSALIPIAENVNQTEQLLIFAERSLDVAEQRHAQNRAEDMNKAVHIAEESVKRAQGLVSAVDTFEVEALRAESTLSSMVADSNSDLVLARQLRGQSAPGELDAAITRLERATADAGRSAEGRRDPLTTLATLREANTALDAVVERLQHRRTDAERIRTQLVTALDEAERQIAIARDIIADYRAPIGPDARTRLAEAERIMDEITQERDPETALQRARRSAALATEALHLAREDLNRPQEPMPGIYRPRSGTGVLTGVLGGLAIGGLLDGFDGLDDLFD